MDQIEKPLSILLIVAAIAFAFMYTDAGDGFTAIQNKTITGYTIESAELSIGYKVNGAATCDIETAYVVDSISQNITDTLFSEINGTIVLEGVVSTTD